MQYLLSYNHGCAGASRWSRCAILIIAIACGLISCQTTDIARTQEAPKHARVIWTESPGSHAIISWTTLYPSEMNTVYFDTVPRTGKTARYAYLASSVRSGKVTMKPMDVQEGVPIGYYHHAELNDLRPDTKYYFTVQSGKGKSREYYFITAPAHTTSIRLLAGGDSRLGGEHPRYAGRTPHRERQQLKTFIGELVETYPDIYAFVHGADYGTTADWRHLYWYFEDLERATTRDGRILPMIVSMGNHDTELGFMENFFLGDEINKTAFSYYYTTTCSANLSLITLNTEISLTGEQYHWMTQALPLARQQSRWLLVNYHKPAFPAAKDPDDYRFSRVREHWVPLFEQHDVDLVIESDGHCLKRTPPILNNQADPEGIVYIGEGGLGAPLREPDTTRWFLQGGYASRTFHVWMLSVSQDSLVMEAIDIDGNQADYSVLVK